MEFTADQKKTLDDLAVENFREYLRIPSVHPNVDYEPCVKFLKEQAQGLGLPVVVHRIEPTKPIVIITWIGKEPTVPSIMLNSHMDVVPVFEDKWTHKPFSADIDKDGKIFARGSQDMKCVGNQYLETVRRLKQKGILLKRTLHLSFVPDEEIGGVQGLKAFVHKQEFRDLNVGCALDEGMANPTDEFILFYGERAIWHILIRCPGQPGHGSLLLENTAGEKINYILNKIYELRKHESDKLKNNPDLTIGDVLTLNLTEMNGGVQANVIPPELSIMIDCRIPVTMDIIEWEKTLNKWCKDAGEGVIIECEQKEPLVPITQLNDDNSYYVAFKKATDHLGLKILPRIFPGGTDSRFVREIGIPAFGFSPMNFTPVLLHDNDEFLTVDTFLKGIEIYCTLIPEIANV